MKTLDLYRLWEICNKLSWEIEKLSESNTYIYLLGNLSNYSFRSFEGFLEYYSFRIEGDNIVIFNQDGIPYEDYSNDDLSYIPICLLSFSAEKLDKWVETEIELQIERLEREKLAEKEDIKLQIAMLEKRLNS